MGAARELSLFDDFHTEEEIRKAVLAAAEKRYGPMLDWLRRELCKRYESRVANCGPGYRFVTADDAREILARHQINLPNNNCLGQLFRVPGWRAIGYYKSRTKGSHANRIMKWEYVGE